MLVLDIAWLWKGIVNIEAAVSMATMPIVESFTLLPPLIRADDIADEIEGLQIADKGQSQPNEQDEKQRYHEGATTAPFPTLQPFPPFNSLLSLPLALTLSPIPPNTWECGMLC